MSDEITNNIIDNYEEHELHTGLDDKCSECYKNYCKICNNTGYISKTEWTGTDTSYDVIIGKCDCK